MERPALRLSTDATIIVRGLSFAITAKAGTADDRIQETAQAGERSYRMLHEGVMKRVTLTSFERRDGLAICQGRF